MNKNSDEPFYFNAEEIGRSLKEVSVSLVEAAPESILSRWYHSEKNVDVYLWLDHRNNIIKQQVHLCGQLVEWNILDGVRTGMVVEMESSSSSEVEESIYYDKEPLMGAIRQAIDIVENTGELSDTDRSTLKMNFHHGKTLNDIDVKEFAQRFGEEKSEEAKKGFWKKFKTWMCS